MLLRYGHGFVLGELRREWEEVKGSEGRMCSVGPGPVSGRLPVLDGVGVDSMT